MREVALRNKKLSRNERELNPKGTVDNVVSYQFLCTLYTKFPKTGCNIFNNCSLHTAIFLILQPAHCNISACLFSAFNYITRDIFPADKKDRLRFPQTVVRDFKHRRRERRREIVRENSNVTLRMSGGKYLDVLLRGPT